METLFTAAAVVTAVGVLVKFTPLRRVVLWLWARNVSEPLTAKADEIVTAVVVRENGGVSLVDLSDHIEKVCDRVDKVSTTVDGLVTLSASSKDRLDVLAEHAAELAALAVQGRKDDIVAVAKIVEQKAAEEQVGVDRVAAELAEQKALLAARAQDHDEINRTVIDMLKAGVLVKVAEDVAEIKRVVVADPEQAIPPTPPVEP